MNSVNCTDILRNACPLRNAYLLTAMWRNTGQGSCSYENDVNTSANNVGYVHKFLFVTWRNCSDEIHFQARNQLFYWGWSRPSSFLPFSLLSSPLLSLFPSFSCPTPKIQLEGSGERCRYKLPQWIRAEPGRQTHFGAIEGHNFANHVNKLACSQHVPINIMLPCAVGGPGTPGPSFGYGPDFTKLQSRPGMFSLEAWSRPRGQSSVISASEPSASGLWLRPHVERGRDQGRWRLSNRKY